MKYIIDYQYFGNINLYKILCKNTNVIFEIYDNYQKSSFRNKMELPSPNGVLQLSIPILGGRGFKGKFKDVKMDNSKPWRNNHIKTINTLYNKSPWFEYYKNELYELYQTEESNLYKWNKICLQWVLKKLKTNAIVAETKNFILEYDNNIFIDCRNNMHNKEDFVNNTLPKYFQVFENKIGFKPNMCILDLLFCEGPNAVNLLQQ